MLNRFTLAAFCLFAAPALAQVNSVVFEREVVTIASPPPHTLAKGETPAPVHPMLSYTIEVRPEDALKLEYIHSLNELTETTGTIAQILPNVVLADLTQDVVAREPIKAFLFLKAGEVKSSGIRPHDIITGKQFTASPPVLQ